MRQYLRTLALLFCSCALSACAVGVQHQYDKATPKLNISTNKSVAVGVHDQRPYILSQDKEENFVGLQRGGYGNPFDVTTASEAPLAQDFATVIVASLKKKGITAVPVKVNPRWSDKDALQALIAAAQDKALIVTLREWKSDTYVNTALRYDATIQVFGKGGNLLAQKSIQGEDDLGGDFINPPGHAKDAVPRAYAQKLEELLNDEKIVASLN